MYTYSAKLIRVVDGDTADFTVDLGFRTYQTQRFRLLGIDAPEKSRGEPGWLEAKEHLEVLLGDGQATLLTHKDPDSFGRWLCEIIKGDLNINEAMIADGFAKPYVK